jgi:diguanylate cyclase (GGDEF)-like protein
MNNAAEVQASKRFPEIIGTDLRSISELQPIVKKNFSKDKNTRFEFISPIDHLSWFNISVSPLYERKKFRGWVAISEDITRRKEIENQLQQLNQRLTRQLGENKELQNQLREQANHDSLTGVYNRGYLSETLVREIARAERKNYPISLIMLDVDHFKNINDTYGHKTGDMVVIALGKMLVAESRKADCVSRFGGDEFILVMPEMNIENAYQKAEIWRNNFSKLKIPGIEKDFVITISIGIACYPINGINADMLLDAADKALYQAKQSGRNCTRNSGE